MNHQKATNKKESKEQQQYYDQYSQQIKNQYSKYPQLSALQQPFITMHSDYLNLKLKQDESVWTKSTFHQGDIILQIRGKAVQQYELNKFLTSIGKNGKTYDGCFGILLRLNLLDNILIRPLGISECLIKSSVRQMNKKYQNQKKMKGNCYIDEHFGSKLLIKALQIIPREQKLIIQQQSLQKYIFK